MTLEEIIAIEPEVGEILRAAADEAEHGGLPYRVSSRCKARLSRLVGGQALTRSWPRRSAMRRYLGRCLDALEL